MLLSSNVHEPLISFVIFFCTVGTAHVRTRDM